MNKNLAIFFFFSLTILFFSCKKESESPILPIESKVLTIFDGDSFRWRNTMNKIVEIRLYGIDCPEFKQDYGPVAKNVLVQLIAGKNITIKKKDTDTYGRTIAIVYLGDTIVNEFMLKYGHAWHYKYYDNNQSWSNLEQLARDSMLGLWANSKAIEPWEWRRLNK